MPLTWGFKGGTLVLISSVLILAYFSLLYVHAYVQKNPGYIIIILLKINVGKRSHYPYVHEFIHVGVFDRQLGGVGDERN